MKKKQICKKQVKPRVYHLTNLNSFPVKTNPVKSLKFKRKRNMRKITSTMDNCPRN